METVKVAVPEDVGPDTPLPDLNLVVDDADTSRNAEYQGGRDGAPIVLPSPTL